MIYSGFSRAMDDHLYGGGAQVERYELCSLCGDDVYDDGVEIDGDWYCGNCFRKRVERMHAQIEKTFRPMHRIDEVALKKALQEYADGIDD